MHNTTRENKRLLTQMWGMTKFYGHRQDVNERSRKDQTKRSDGQEDSDKQTRHRDNNRTNKTVRNLQRGIS
ncbi:hypothetical protein E2C01_060959 [Portunus trituberculatus]|uniref:Uncharacterized protein n=1 Tax=Portunus trituberculatus TaxID=210409 RepID=A0A5B7HA35_PORTR|nr:hypothetical protein [Portunus trituberculatus]